MKKLLFLSVMLCVALAGCGGGGGGTRGPDPIYTPSGLTTKINSINFTASVSGAEYRRSNGVVYLNVWAVDSSGLGSVAVNIPMPPNTPITAPTTYAAVMLPGRESASAATSGTLTVTELDSQHCKGTFSFTTPDYTVTGGTFDVAMDQAPETLNYVPGTPLDDNGNPIWPPAPPPAP